VLHNHVKTGSMHLSSWSTYEIIYIYIFNYVEMFLWNVCTHGPLLFRHA